MGGADGTQESMRSGTGDRGSGSDRNFVHCEFTKFLLLRVWLGVGLHSSTIVYTVHWKPGLEAPFVWAVAMAE